MNPCLKQTHSNDRTFYPLKHTTTTQAVLSYKLYYIELEQRSTKSMNMR